MMRRILKNISQLFPLVSFFSSVDNVSVFIGCYKIHQIFGAHFFLVHIVLLHSCWVFLFFVLSYLPSSFQFQFMKIQREKREINQNESNSMYWREYIVSMRPALSCMINRTVCSIIGDVHLIFPCHFRWMEWRKRTVNYANAIKM